MDKRIERYKHCDPRFYPYLDKVLERLPGEVKEELLADEGVQILAQEDLHDTCAARFAFEKPVSKLLYLNMRVLNEPDQRIILALAHEIARHVSAAGEGGGPAAEAGELLLQWGFEGELEAVCHERRMAESEGYRRGYQWASHQDEAYLLRHFGFYFDEWSNLGLAKMHKDRSDQLRGHADLTAILSELGHYGKSPKREKTDESGEQDFSVEEATIAGIMAAVNEVKRRRGSPEGA